MKRCVLAAGVYVLLWSCSPQQKEHTEQQARPNIIVIMTDDHAKRAISAYGSNLVNTPNIDRIGKEGIRFDNAFVTNSLCGPSRAVILTGKYSHINGFRDNASTFDNTQMTFPKMLREAGYYTAVVGKWHLVTEPTGFDYWNIHIDQGSYYNPDMVEMGDTTRVTGYATDIVTDMAIATLDKRPTGKPFMLMLHQKAPHRNWMPNFKHLGVYDNDTIPLPPTFYDDYATRTRAAKEQDMEIRNMFLSSDIKVMLRPGERDPGSGGSNQKFAGDRIWAGDYGRFNDEQRKMWDDYYKPITEEFYKRKLKGKELEEWMYQRYMKDYLACVMSVDENIGRVFEYLEKNNLLDNTMIIYTSDQGFFLGEHGWYDKRFMYEETMSTPMLIRYPLKVSGGLVSDKLVLNLDLTPTILEAAGVEVPATLQGKSLLPLMSKTPEQKWRTGVYYHYYEYPYGWHNVKKHYGIRTDRYKLIHFYNDIDDWELYDLKQDPSELNNLYNKPEYKTLVDSLKAELYKLKEHYRDTARLQVK